jgi:hypothetical protein
MMERTKNNTSIQTLSGRQIQVMTSAIVSRALLSARLGMQQYGGSRDIYQALGYKDLLTFDDFLARYIRQDIARAIIDRPVKATWQGPIELVESNITGPTLFEDAWRDLDKRFGLKSRLSRVDRLTGIGQYGILLLGLDDVKKPEDWLKPARVGAKLTYVKPYSERTARITNFVSNTADPRYGLPSVYTINVPTMYDDGYVNLTTTESSVLIQVHFSRIVHIIDDSLESEILGNPRLEVVFNRLMDLDKLVGGDAEMFWRGARPGYQGSVNPDFTMTQETKDDLTDQIAEYENNLRRILVNEGVDLKALAQEIADPTGHVDMQLTMISAVTGIPKRILSGSERGELASTQDQNEWRTFVQSRREDHAEPRIIRPFVDKLIELKILPTVKDYKVNWIDLFSISEKDRVDIGKSRANAIREYTTNPMAEAIIPPDAFLDVCLGLDTDQIALITKMRAEGISEEQMNLAQDVIKTLPPSTAGSPGQGKAGAGIPAPSANKFVRTK